MHHFSFFLHEAGMISGCRSQIYTLEKPSTKLRLSGSGWASLQYDKYPDDCDDNNTAACWSRGEDTQNWVFYYSEVNKVQFEQHHSLCSIFTFGGLRKDLFFFSLLFLPFAWKVLQLSTRPSLVSWQMVCKKSCHLRNAKSKVGHHVSIYK